MHIAFASGKRSTRELGGSAGPVVESRLLHCANLQLQTLLQQQQQLVNTANSTSIAMSSRSALRDIDLQNPGLLGALPRADLGLLASGAVVFGVQRLVPTYDDSWYKAIKKPSWTPPNWVFPAMWIPLKVLQSVSLWLVLKQADTRKELVLPLSLFGLHLFLGNWWNVVFFGSRKMDESLKWMGTFWLSIAGSIASFAQVSPLAAALFAPTQLWVTVAAKLNWDIVKLNTGNKQA